MDAGTQIDTRAIRRLAAALRDRAGWVRTEADALVAQTDAVGWLGRAGDALHDRVRGRALALRRSAMLHEEAADALDRHVRAVEGVQDLLEEAGRRALDLLDAAAPS